MRFLSSLVKSVSVLIGIYWCECYMIHYLINNNFSLFCKNFHLETESILKITPLIMASNEAEKKMPATIYLGINGD